MAAILFRPQSFDKFEIDWREDKQSTFLSLTKQPVIA